MNKKDVLTAKAVNEIFMKVLFTENEIKNGKPIVKPMVGMGITRDFGFFPKRINEKKEEIKNMLLQLPKEFMESYGGDSFLNACITKDGTQWTGFHEIVEKLISMGNALGLVEYTTPKKMWSFLSGGVPCFIVKDK